MKSMLMYQRGVLPYFPPPTNVSFGLGQSELMSQGVRHSVRKTVHYGNMDEFENAGLQPCPD